jgi:hypothetical protein
MTQIVNGKGAVVPLIVRGRNPFDIVYREADKVMSRTEYVWCNRREIGFEWDYELKVYKLVLRDDVTGRKFSEFVATKSAISSWAAKANSTLSRSVWTVVSYQSPTDDLPTAMAVLTDQYAILSYTDIVSSVEKVSNELAHDHRTRVQRIEISPDHLKLDLVMHDLAVPTELQSVGDVLSVGVQVQSGLTGKAAVSILPYCIRLSCLNRMTRSYFGEDSGDKVRFIHRWGGMRFDIGDNPIIGNNIDWLQSNASAKLGYKYTNSLRQAVFSNLEDSVNIVRGAAVAANSVLTSDEAPRRLVNIVDMWIGEAPASGVDFRKKDFEFLKGDMPRTHFIAAATEKLQYYGATLGYSMYTIIQALTERPILLSLPSDVRVAVEDWAARYCIDMAAQYDPSTTPVENISSEDFEKILDGLNKRIGGLAYG